MSAPVFTETAYVEIAAIPGSGSGIILDPISYTVTLDESRTPYITATITANAPTPFDPAEINPYTGLKVLLVISRSQVSPVIPFPDDSRMFYLLLHEVTVDHKTGVMTLTGVSGEAAWLDAARDGDVPALTALQGAVNGLDARTLVAGYLADPPYGAPLTLTPGLTTGTLIDDTPSTFFRWTNTATNPSLTTNTTGYSASNCSIVRDTSWGRVGSSSLRIYAPSGSATSYVDIAGGPGAMREGMAPGFSYLARATMRTRTALGGQLTDSARRLQIVIKDATGTYRALAESEQASVTVGDDTELEVRFTIPYGTTEAWRRIVHGHASGDTQWDAFLLTYDMPLAIGADFPDEIRYFDTSNVIRWYDDGVGAPGETTTYPNYTLSAGPTLEFKPYSDAAQPQPYSAYWDVIAQIMDASGTRVFCDEVEDWHLARIGAQNAAEHTLDLDWVTSLQEVQSLQRTELGRPLWADSIVVDFVDRTGVKQTTVDQLGATRIKTWRTEAVTNDALSAAAASTIALRMLAGVARRSRTFEVQAVTILSMTPGDVVELPLGLDPVIASQVTITSEGTMALTTRAPEA